MTGRRKAAILLLSLGPEVASDIYRSLTDQEIEHITLEIANLGSVPPELSAQVIEEFYHTAMAKQYISHGGVSTARELLEKALGTGKAIEILDRLQGVIGGAPFDFLKHVDPHQLLSFVQNEHPQTIALILAHLDKEHGAVVMSALTPAVQKEVALRIATMEHTSPEIIAEVERVLERKLASVLAQEFSSAGGVDTLAELLNRVEPGTGKNILEALERTNQELATEIKKQMFTFDDLVILDDRTLQMVLREVDPKDLAAALKGAGDAVRNQIFGNMSSRAAQSLRDDIETLGPVRIKQVEESQQKILSTIRRMAEDGEITVYRSGNEQYVE